MKTLFVCGNAARIHHTNEEYDEILYVTDEPTVVNIDKTVHMIQDSVRRLHHKDEMENGDKIIQITIDAAPQYYAVMEHIILTMKTNEKIIIEFPQNKTGKAV